MQRIPWARLGKPLGSGVRHLHIDNILRNVEKANHRAVLTGNPEKRAEIDLKLKHAPRIWQYSGNADIHDDRQQDCRVDIDARFIEGNTQPCELYLCQMGEDRILFMGLETDSLRGKSNAEIVTGICAGQVSPLLTPEQRETQPAFLRSSIGVSVGLTIPLVLNISVFPISFEHQDGALSLGTALPTTLCSYINLGAGLVVNEKSCTLSLDYNKRESEVLPATADAITRCLADRKFTPELRRR